MTDSVTGGNAGLARRFLRLVKLTLFCPLLAPVLVTNRKPIIYQDASHWLEVLGMEGLSPLTGLLTFLATYPEFLNLYRYRLRTGNLAGRAVAAMVCWPYSEQAALFLQCPDIGPGLFLQHAFSTIITAQQIGKNCWINQQVTIGYKANSGCPVLGDGVIVGAGAKVLGSVRIGDHVTIGANAVVLTDVPDNCVVAGVPARIIRRNGVRTEESR